MEQKSRRLSTRHRSQLSLADADPHRKQREKRWKIRSHRDKVIPISSAQLASSPYKSTNFTTETSLSLAIVTFFANVKNAVGLHMSPEGQVHGITQQIAEFVRAHEMWAAPIVGALAFGESLAFVSSCSRPGPCWSRSAP